MVKEKYLVHVKKKFLKIPTVNINIDWPKVKIINHGTHWRARKISQREAISTYQREPEMNRDSGYQLALVYEAVLSPT